MIPVHFSATDPMQTLFLSALSLGESSHRADAQWLGCGGQNLSHRPCRPDGFPLWDGVEGPGGISHAAGVFQFEPGTWADIAFRYSCHFGNVQDQYKAAWCLASEVFLHKTGTTLYSALETKHFEDLQDYLAKTWPSVKGNGANPIGLAKYMSHLAKW